MPNNNSKTILDQIVDAKVVEVSKQKELVPQNVLEGSISHALPPVSMSKALSRIDNIALLAEIKKASPSKGLLCPDFNHITLAHTYAANGASGISILTDPRFQGELQHLYDIKQSATIQSLPVLRKDFIIDEYQIYESRAYGADLFLLIATWLDKYLMRDLLCLGEELGMPALIETHNEQDLEKAFEASAKMIGINNRDLTNGKTDLGITRRLAPMALQEKDKILVCESGIHGRKEIEEFEGLGVHAFLIGESLMVSKNIPAKLKELQGCEES